MRVLYRFPILLLLPLPALAAEVTDMPGALEATGGLTYSGSAEWNALEEAGIQIAGRRVQRHDLNYELEFAPVEGFALVLDISHTPSLRYAYPDASTMLIEPVGGGGTYLLGEPTGETAVTSASGINGIWIGAAAAPFAERYGLNDQATWRIDLAFRTPSAGMNLWTASNGNRGTSPGGSAIKIQGAFSSDLGTGTPWLQVAWVKENKVTVDLVDEAGTTWATDVVLRPASTLDVLTGIEIVGVDHPDVGTRFAVDLFLGFGYRTWEDVGSGVYLPNVIGGSRQIPVTVGEQINARAGIAFDYHINENVRVRTGPDLRVHTPFRPEHVYADVRTTPENIAVGWLLRVEGALDFSE